MRGESEVRTLHYSTNVIMLFNLMLLVLLLLLYTSQYNLDATDYGDRLKARALIQYVDSRVDIDIHPNTTDYF